MKDAWDKLNELREHPELADTPGYGLEILRRYGDPVMWFLLLMEHPEFEPPWEWWYDLRKRAGLPWAHGVGREISPGLPDIIRKGKVSAPT